MKSFLFAFFAFAGVCIAFLPQCDAFQSSSSVASRSRSVMSPALFASSESQEVSRRHAFQQSAALLFGLSVAPSLATAAERQSLESVLYRILRVREATQQEVRLIKSGKFKDVQRANVKLAVKFMVNNYRLGDAFVTASSYLDGNDRRVLAGQVGQSAVQNLVTILEYFDSSDVENLKVRTRMHK